MRSSKRIAEALESTAKKQKKIINDGNSLYTKIKKTKNDTQKSKNTNDNNNNNVKNSKKTECNNLKSENNDQKSSRISHWILKAEPNSRIVNGFQLAFTYEDLEKEKISPWDGVRNYGSRNQLKSMVKGDKCFFYASNCASPGIIGIVEIVKEAYPDPLATSNPNHPYYDQKSTEENNKWVAVDVAPVRKFKNPILRQHLKENADLKNMAVLRQSRASVSPVTDNEWNTILQMDSSESNVK